MDLVKKYKITRVDALKCSLIRSLKGSGMPPHYLLRYSSNLSAQTIFRSFKKVWSKR